MKKAVKKVAKKVALVAKKKTVATKETKTVACPDCGGTGLKDRNNLCSSCEGSGAN